jgi:hypothetical protein
MERATAMERMTVMVPKDLSVRARKKAKALGISVGELVRESLVEKLCTGNAERRKDPFFADRVVFHGKTPPDLAANHDKYLYGDDA